MKSSRTRISVKGRQIEVPFIQINGFEIVATGRWLKIAAVKSEDYAESDPSVNPKQLVTELQNQNLKADIFSFAQRVPDNLPKYQMPMSWDNLAVLSTMTYAAWWDALSQETRRNVRLAQKRGLVVRPVEFDDELVRGIMGIYNETPVRQGRRFWHYGKDFDTVKRENGTFLDRSQFVGAYLGNELVGFLKFVRVGQLASIMQILSQNKHQDKKPMNALVAKAVEMACEKQLTHLLYRQYVYHRPDALTEFKRRNGFQKILVPRYFVPLTVKGNLAVKLHLHRGFKEFLPGSVKNALLDLRHTCINFIGSKS